MDSVKPKIKPVVLIVLDGWGVAPPSSGNAITLTKTPIFNQLLTTYPVMTLQAAGEAVGLPWGESGNSEVGHLNLGAGKIVWQSLPKINHAIADGKFFTNTAFIKAINHVKQNKSKLHLIGLVSNGGVHSSLDHLFALLDLAKHNNVQQVFVHAILDGRDTAFNAGQSLIKSLEDKLEKISLGKIATICGRYYAMDRDNYWERTAKAYQAIVEGQAEVYAKNPLEAINDSYQRQIFDEEFVPTVMVDPHTKNFSVGVDKNNQPLVKITDNDAVILFNFRPERMRQLTRALVLPNFDKFARPARPSNLLVVTMTEYEPNLPVQVAFAAEKVEHPLAQILSEANLRQFHLAETQKYAHVTFFFNGGAEKPFAGEDRLLIPSPRLSSFDQKPEMAAPEIAAQAIKAVNSGVYDFIIINFANPDMVGHTGNLSACQAAVKVIDELLGKILVNILKAGGAALITADHGNIEETINLRNGEIDKEHSANPVPLILVGKDFELSKPLVEPPDLSLLTPSGVLADVAPTILKIMGLPKPSDMTGTPLILDTLGFGHSRV